MPTKIEWCDETFNPWWGCERVSPACAHCYADTFARRIGMPDLWAERDHRATHAFRFFEDKHWDEPLKWARRLPAKLGRRPRIFCASMADVFEDHPDLVEPRKRLIDLIYRTLELDWLLLTKRPENVARMLGPDGVGLYAVEGVVPCPQPNVWVGTSIENARFTWRADALRETAAAIRFISAEPLLGSLFPRTGAREAEGSGPLSRPVNVDRVGSNPTPSAARRPLNLSGIDWLIIGGESGAKSRPFHLAHARELLAHAALEEDVAVFVKQLGAKPIETRCDVTGQAIAPRPRKLVDRKGGDIDEWPPDLRVREFPLSKAA